MNKELEYLKEDIEKLKDEVDEVRCLARSLWAVCIALTAVLTATFMHVFIL